jgi:hypothetical protein
MELTQAYLKTVIHYDPDTGIFTWLPRSGSMFKEDRFAAAWNGRFANKEVGCDRGQGYLVTRVGGSLFFVHRLAFLYITGSFPADQVDHINGVRDDNRWGNLRAASGSENRRNQKIPYNNTSGHVGVHWHKGQRKWQARIMVAKRWIYLGSFSEISDAIAARKVAAIEHGYHQNHGRG